MKTKSRVDGNAAFSLYIALGVNRSYELVGRHFGVSKRTIVAVARRESWSRRLAEIDVAARKIADQEFGETLAETRERHLRLVRAMSMRAARAIQKHELESAWDGIRAAEIAVKLERVILGLVAERTSLSVEATTRAEMDKFLQPAEDAEDLGNADDLGDAAIDDDGDERDDVDEDEGGTL